MPVAVTTTVCLLALTALLVTAYRHPSARVELAVAAAATALCALVGALPWAMVREETERLGPVVVLLAALLVISDQLRREGVFARLGHSLAANPALWAVVVAGAVTTTTLGLDATVVLLTPIVVAASAGVISQVATIRMANSASLLLPVSNLTNLLVLHEVGLSVGAFALTMAPAWIAVIAVEYAALALWQRSRRPVAASPATAELPQPDRMPRTGPILLVMMLTGFVAGSGFGVDPAVVAVVIAVAMALIGWYARRATWREVVDSAHLPFCLFVVALGLVVAAVSSLPLAAHLDALVPEGSGLGTLLIVAVVAAVAANVVNNLPATLLLAPLVAPLGTEALLAMLIGVNVGSGLTWTGSLANLLWRRVLVAHQQSVPSREFHAFAAIVTAPAVVVGVVVLHLTFP